jgi:hypothetical protein
MSGWRTAPLFSQPGTSAATVPSLAGVWDALFDRKNGYIADREAAWQMREAWPGWRELPRMQSHFLDRAVDYLVEEAGIAQIIEIGCGFPRGERKRSLHEIAQETNPHVRVVYADPNPIVVAHAGALMRGRGTAAILVDVTDLAAILDDKITRELLDLNQPYAVLLIGVLQHLTDEQDPAGVADRLKAAMAPGCYLAVCNLLGGDTLGVPPPAEEAERVWDKAMPTIPARFRDWDQHRAYLTVLDIIEPGLVYADEWRPDEHLREVTQEHTLMCAGIGRVPARTPDGSTPQPGRAA